MQPLKRLGAFARAERAERCLLVVDSSVGEGVRGQAEDSLKQAGLEYKVHPIQRQFRWPHGAQVREAVEVAEDFAPNAVVGLGAGGTLDVSKAVSAVYGRQHGRRERLREIDRILAGRGPPLEPPLALPTLLVPTTPSVASTSGRVLLLPDRNDAQMCLTPLVVAGPRAVGVGVGLQARRVVADPTITACSANAPVTAAAAAHALSIFVDGVTSAAGTLKAKMLWDDIAEGLTSTRTALKEPSAAHIDALLATMAAGQSASDADANAYGGLSCLHELSCIAAVSWKELPFASVSASLVPPMLRIWATHANEAERESLEQLAAAVLVREGCSLDELADWVSARLLEAGVPRLGASAPKKADAAAVAGPSETASSFPSSSPSSYIGTSGPTATTTTTATKTAPSPGQPLHSSSSRHMLVDPKLDAAVLALRSQQVLAAKQRRCPDWLLDSSVLTKLFLDAATNNSE